MATLERELSTDHLHNMESGIGNNNEQNVSAAANVLRPPMPSVNGGERVWTDAEIIAARSTPGFAQTAEQKMIIKRHGLEEHRPGARAVNEMGGKVAAETSLRIEHARDRIIENAEMNGQKARQGMVEKFDNFLTRHEKTLGTALSAGEEAKKQLAHAWEVGNARLNRALTRFTDRISRRFEKFKYEYVAVPIVEKADMGVKYMAKVESAINRATEWRADQSVKTMANALTAEKYFTDLAEAGESNGQENVAETAMKIADRMQEKAKAAAVRAMELQQQADNRTSFKRAVEEMAGHGRALEDFGKMIASKDAHAEWRTAVRTRNAVKALGKNSLEELTPQELALVQERVARMEGKNKIK